MDRPNNPSETKYLLIGEEEFERLLRSYYILGKGLLAFEYLCGHSDRPMYLSAEGVCEVLGITRDELDEHRLKRQIKAKVFQRQMMYSLIIWRSLVQAQAGPLSKSRSYEIRNSFFLAFA